MEKNREAKARKKARKIECIILWFEFLVFVVLCRYIPTAAAFGGLCIGALSVLADFMGKFHFDSETAGNNSSKNEIETSV